MRVVTVTTEFEAPAEVVWPALRTPHAFVHVASGMLRYPAAERCDRPWAVGDQLHGWTFLFGLLPFSKHRLTIESIDDEERRIVSDESGGLVRRWHHEIELTRIDDARSAYLDRIEIDAGVMTWLVAAFAHVFYRHRQRRWRRLARLLAATSMASMTSSAMSEPTSSNRAGTRSGVRTHAR